MTEKKLKNPVVLVHGYADVAWVPWWDTLKEHFREYDPEVEIHQTDFGTKFKIPYSHKKKSMPATAVGSIKDYSKVLEEKIESIDAETVDIVAHSMGGLVSRWYIQERGGSENVDNLVTLGTPHRGTLTAYAVPFTTGGKELRPGSDLLEKLNRRLAEDVDHTVVWSSWDQIILPSRNACIPDDLVERYGNVRHIEVKAFHRPLVSHRGVFEKYIEFLD